MRRASAVASRSIAVATRARVPVQPPASAEPSGVRAAPVGVELAQEELAPLLLVGLADAAGHAGQPGEAAKEAAVGRMAPPHVPRSPPSRPPQRVQAPVVPDAEVGVGLDVVAGQLAQPGPALQDPRM